MKNHSAQGCSARRTPPPSLGNRTCSLSSEGSQPRLKGSPLLSLLVHLPSHKCSDTLVVCCCCCCFCCEVMSVSFVTPWTDFCPWGFPGKTTKAGCHFLLQWIEPASPALQTDSLPLSHVGSPTLVVIRSQVPLQSRPL